MFRLIAGWCLLILGCLLLVLPGPGIPLILLALPLLAPTHPWADKLIHKILKIMRRP